jgi:hypothetical protein
MFPGNVLEIRGVMEVRPGRGAELEYSYKDLRSLHRKPWSSDVLKRQPHRTVMG